MILYRPVGTKELELIRDSGYAKIDDAHFNQFEIHVVGGEYVTFHTRAKVVGIMRQNACPLAFCVQNLL